MATLSRLQDQLFLHLLNVPKFHLQSPSSPAILRQPQRGFRCICTCLWQLSLPCPLSLVISESLSFSISQRHRRKRMWIEDDTETVWGGMGSVCFFWSWDKAEILLLGEHSAYIHPVLGTRMWVWKRHGILLTWSPTAHLCWVSAAGCLLAHFSS